MSQVLCLWRKTLICQYIEKHSSITNSEAHKLLNLQAPTVRKLFRKMLDESIIQAVGKNRSRKYIDTVAINKKLVFNSFFVRVSRYFKI